MIHFRANGTIWVWAVLTVAICSLQGQSASDYAVRLTATVQTSSPRITLSWPGDPQATGYTLNRKLRDGTSWGSTTSLGTGATSYSDSTAAAGTGYEYRITKTAPTGSSNYTAYGYIYAGVNLPLVEARGKVILLVDDTYASSLASELTRLQYDLVGDGWTVLLHNVARTSSVPSIKSLITADYNSAPSSVKAVFLLGHVPVPYSGDIAPDGHPEHKGAWPADAYYGDMDGSWTDTTVNDSAASDPRNHNVPGDGKFDRSLMASSIELQVGRVDLFNLPAFPLSDLELLRQYLDKDHNFRHRLISADRRGLIDDHFGAFSGEAFAANGWRAFAPLVGTVNTVAADWLTTLSSQSYLWGYGCGGGTYTSASGVADTWALVTNDTQVVFTLFFGSYFGDWDSPNNFLRAQLATTSYTLASAWAGRPYWIPHHMGLGETIGFGARVTQNNGGSLYSGNFGTNWVHISLMGDPTLRLHPVAPPAVLVASSNPAAGIDLAWNPSLDTVAGYHVYRSTSVAGPFTNLTVNLLTGSRYTDSAGTAASVYMVRAVKLEQSPSGTYTNVSQGVFQSLTPSVSTPAITLTQPANNSVLIAPLNLRIYASLFDPAALVTNVTFYTNGQLLASAPLPPFTLTWTNPPLGFYTLTAIAQSAPGFTTDAAPVTFTVDNGGRPQLSITPIADGSNVITGQDVLGRSYRLQFMEALSTTNWQTLGTATTDLSGTFQFVDSNAATQRFYRTLYP
jgi:Bacterial Ig domain